MGIKNIIKKFGKPKDERGQLTMERDDKCIPIAKKILKMIAEYDVDFNSATSDEELRKKYDKIAVDILQLFLDEDIKVNDTNFTFRTINTIIGTVKNIIEQSLTFHLEKAETNLWGKDPNDITMQNLELVMRLDRSKLNPKIEGGEVKKVKN